MTNINLVKKKNCTAVKPSGVWISQNNDANTPNRASRVSLNLIYIVPTVGSIVGFEDDFRSESSRKRSTWQPFAPLIKSSYVTFLLLYRPEMAAFFYKSCKYGIFNLTCPLKRPGWKCLRRVLMRHTVQVMNMNVVP